MNRRERRRQAKQAKGVGKESKAADHAFRGEQLAGEGKIDEAIDAFQLAISIDPLFAAAHHNLGILLRRQGLLSEAIESYLRATSIQPEYVDAHYNLGNALLDQGNLDGGVASYHKALAIKPDFAQAHNNLGNAFIKQGKFDEALISYQNALACEAEYADAHKNLGNALQKLGKLEDAVTSYRKAIAIKPDFAGAHNNLGATLEELGRLDEAIASYHNVLSIKPKNGEAHYNLGNALLKLERPDEAFASCQKALTINPGYAEAHNSLGATLKELGRLDEAIASYHKAIAIKPEFAQAHYNLGIALQKLGQLEDAVASYHKAITIKPDYAEAWNNLGIVFMEQGHIEEACENYQKAIALDPEYVQAFDNLGNAHLARGEADEAQRCFNRMREFDENTLKADIKSLLCFPLIVPSTDKILQQRATLADALKTIGANGETLKTPFKDIGLTNFYFAYHGLNDRKLIRGIADMYLRVAPSLNWQAQVKTSGWVSSDKIRIGFLSAFLKNHTIGKLNRGLIEKLDRDQFEVIVFRFPHAEDELSALIDQAADRVVVIQKNLETARERIAAEDLDILFYPEIGMDPFTYFLAFSRFAPVQVVTWGHPDTTGIPNIDYFLSSQDLEVHDADKHYNEKLIRLRHLSIFYYPTEPPASPPGRAHFGLPEDTRLYVIAQTLFKFHPDFDSVLGALLRADPDGRLVLISGNTGHWDELLKRRFKSSFPNEADRVIFVPRMDGDDFMGLLGIADALLDIHHFGGGNTSYEAFSAGIPIVAWPTPFLRGRITYAQYQAMGVRELIADDAGTYVDLALRLAKDLPFREKMKKRIAENSHLLFERHEAVREMEEFFVAAVEASRNNSELEKW